jgi:transposase-like protein
VPTAATFFAVGLIPADPAEAVVVLVELNMVEQRYQAVLEVLNDGASVTEVARRRGVARQAVHEWMRRYAADGLSGLADHSSKPLSCPHQMLSQIPEAGAIRVRARVIRGVALNTTAAGNGGSPSRLLVCSARR